MAQALERRWWKRYLGDKDPATYRTWKAAYWNDLLAPYQESLNLDRPQRILDAGCGPAGINLVLDRHDVVAIDPLLDRYATDLAAWPELRHKNVDYRNTSLEAFRPKALFDGACCLNAINHVNDLDRALDALFAAVKPGGWILLGIDAHTATWRKHLFRAIPGDALHPHQHDAAEYTTMLTARGASILRTDTHKPGRIFDYVLVLARKR